MDANHGITLEARNADLARLAEVLRDQRARAMDLVAGAAKFSASDGQVQVHGADPLVTEQGVTDPNGTYDLTSVAEQGLADKLDVPGQYLRKLRDKGRLDLWDANVNGLLHGFRTPEGVEPCENDPRYHAPYPKPLMLRILRGDKTGTGVLRAVLSDRYARIDNLDVLLAALAGVRDAGVAGEVRECNLTERGSMYVNIEAPEVRAMAPGLLAGYRNPFGPGGIERAQDAAEINRWRAVAAREGQGYEPGTEPVISAGLTIRNSESGNGKFVVAPRLVVQICRNGLVITTDALATQHLGGRLEEGVIEWSADTNRKALELVASKAKDAVQAYLSEGYLAQAIARLEEAAGTPVTNAAETIRLVTKQTDIPAELEDEILSAFIAGGQLTAGGVMQAVTAAAQTVTDAEIQALMEAEAVKVLHAAARIG
jgi:hypothetical protein